MNFRKCILLFLSVLLLVCNSRLTFNVHYCGDKIAAISFKIANEIFDSNENCCAISAGKSSCCNDKSFQFQENSDKCQESKTILDFDLNSIYAQNKSQYSIINTNFKNIQKTNGYSLLNNLPPIYERNCQLVFYA